LPTANCLLPTDKSYKRRTYDFVSFVREAHEDDAFGGAGTGRNAGNWDFKGRKLRVKKVN